MSGSKILDISELNDLQITGLAGGNLLKIDISKQLDAYRLSNKSRSHFTKLLNNKDNNDLLWSLFVNLAKSAPNVSED